MYFFFAATSKLGGEGGAGVGVVSPLLSVLLFSSHHLPHVAPADNRPHKTSGERKRREGK